ncbi:MAG: thioredoxin-disulfide reductase [Deltaproteobacteria bacterium]|jgi:thioredoxin reductase (NADPH)|nr:thioredoxin-disulfide reductase [Deltaproteobacteria bacterium]
MIKVELLIIGGGPAGLTAAIYGARAGLDTLVLEHVIPGGQMRLTNEIENFPGHHVVTGHQLSETLSEQAQKQGAKIETGNVKLLKINDDKKIVETSEETYETKALIIATGTRHRNLDSPGAEEYLGKGVSFCALCDGGFVRNQIIAVVGGGNSALEEADYLTRYAKKVYVIHRRNEFRAEKYLQKRAIANPKIEFILDSVVHKMEGSDIIEKIYIENVKTSEITELEVGGVFLYVGNAPNTHFLPPEIKTSPAGWIETNELLETSVAGIFAAGDVRTTDLRQIVTAAADGARAAINANRYLEKLSEEPENS